MSINFDSVPKENPFGLPEPGIYYAVIKEAVMKDAKDASKPQYLNIKYELQDANSNVKGVMYDIMAESDSQVVLYKIGRFCRACGIPLTGSIELRDLAKIIVGKKIVVDVKIDDSNEKYIKPVVDLFSKEAYYTAAEYSELVDIDKKLSADDDGFINAPVGDTPFNADTEASAEPQTNAEY